MDDTYKIYVEQLRDGHIEYLDESFPPELMDINDKDLAFKDEVLVRGEAYLAENTLVLNLNVSTFAILPCTICMEPVKVELNIEGFYFTVLLSEIKSAVFNFKEILREEILLAVPAFAECEGGKCPKRKDVAQYLKTPEEKGNEGKSDDEGYQPFADLQWDNINKKKK